MTEQVEFFKRGLRSFPRTPLSNRLAGQESRVG